VSAETRRWIAIVPAYNEERNIGQVIDELRAFDPGLDVVVVSDGSADRTAEVAAEHGAHVVRLPFNLGIGGAVQAGFRYAWVNGYELAVRCDGDGQHIPAELPKVIAPVLAGEADIAVGSRFAGGEGYRSSATRRIGIRLLALIVSAIARQRVTDTTSGFQALNRKALELTFGPGPNRTPLTAEEVKEGFASFYYDLTAGTSRAQLGAIRELVPVSQLLMGFDRPYMPEWSIGPAIRDVEQWDGFTQDDLHRIAHKNAFLLFPAVAVRAGYVKGQVSSAL